MSKVAVYKPGAIAAATSDGAKQVMSALDAYEEMGANRFVLQTLKVPSGTSPAVWGIEGPDGELEAVKAFRGIIGGIKGGERKFYIRDIGEGSGGPPDCSSTDGKVGVGIRAEDEEPSEQECKTCLKNLFKSARNHKAKACAESILLYFFTEGSFAPSVMSVPPGSFKAVRLYMARLIGQGSGISGVITEATLKPIPGEVPYHEVSFSPVADVSESEREAMAPVVERMKSFVVAMSR